MMDKLENVTDLVKREIADYVVPSPNATAYFLENDDQQMYAVVSIPKQNPQKTSVMLVARVIGDCVVVESDKTDRPLYEELVRAGISRERIVLAYEGESLPTVKG